MADHPTSNLDKEEPLLYERSNEGACGVDLPSPKGLTLRTSLPMRERIGLPQLSETDVIRHFVRISRKNYDRDYGIYPLGSCTMKHNPRVSEKVARYPGFAAIHPLQPESQAQGALQVIYEMQEWLSSLSGLPAVSLNPAAGAHGELAGMMMIRAAHARKGEKRKIVLIPDSAHGTNPATATACGYAVRTIRTDSAGMVDFESFKGALDSDVAALMLTNPNTCGIFERRAKEMAELLRVAGAYFYCDGANFNALVGRIRPADFGVDVMHFNLHKTFASPHGGGGPGAGPIAATEELRPFLPMPLVAKQDDYYKVIDNQPYSIGKLKGFYGQFGVILRALCYILSHGIGGLRQASEDAVLSANYVLSQLQDHYHAPFADRCMHECLLSDKLQRKGGVSTYDIAKALIEHEIHPMTVYFPLVVRGAMLIEPTESEPKSALDEFIAAMRMIAQKVAAGNTSEFKRYPSTDRRIDETAAARKPKLKWDRP
ncbi:glycine dehydrogenase (aminomethyl-transferring) [Rickettsiales bacterium]|nr:glycine dehydrogenase (aminomethyl-transferring) [Rickettsiales bacterium]